MRDQQSLRHLSSPSAERSVLGAALIDSSIPSWLGLPPDAFYDPKNRFVWEAMVALHAQGRPIDEVTMEAQLELDGRLDAIGGLAYLGGLAGAVPTADNVEHYAAIVRDYARQRAYAMALGSAYSRIAAPGCTPEEAERILDACQGQLSRERKGTKPVTITLAEAARAEMRIIWTHHEARAAGQEMAIGVKTGIRSLDRLTGGLPRKIPTLLGGRPKQGKSTTALAMARAAALAYPDEIVIYVSYEDEPDMSARRSLAWASDVNYARIKVRALDDGEMRQLLRGMESLSKIHNLHLFPAKGMSLAEVRRICLALGSQHQVSLVVLDYIQNTPNPEPGMKRHLGIEENFRIFETTIHDLGSAGLMVSQLKRNDGRPPDMEDFKDSGSLEQKGKLILAVFANDDMKARRAGELHILAHAEGVDGMVLDLHYDLSRQTVQSRGMS